jgi:hypothetical protein
MKSFDGQTPYSKQIVLKSFDNTYIDSSLDKLELINFLLGKSTPKKSPKKLKQKNRDLKVPKSPKMILPSPRLPPPREDSDPSEQSIDPDELDEYTIVREGEVDESMHCDETCGKRTNYLENFVINRKK